MALKDWNDFKGAAKRLDDIDLVRIGREMGVGEDELHAVIATEASNSGFDSQGRPKALYEPHVAYRNSRGVIRDKLVAAGLAYPKWGEKPYPKDSYPRIKAAFAIDENVALLATSWGGTQILGENFNLAGYASVQDMVRDMMADEEVHVDAMAAFIKAKRLDVVLRKLAALKRPTTPDDCIPFVEVYNGPKFRKNRYHIIFAANHNKWRKIPDTPWSEEAAHKAKAVRAPATIAPTPIAAQPAAKPEEIVKNVQALLRHSGYPEVGNVDGKYGSRTRNAILAFQADNGLPLSGLITDELISSLVKAPQRVMAPARAEASEADLKENVPATINPAIWLRRLGVGVLATSGFGGIADGTGDLDKVFNGLSKIRSIVEVVMSVSPWVLLAVVGGGAAWLGSKVVGEHIKAYREGRLV